MADKEIEELTVKQGQQRDAEKHKTFRGLKAHPDDFSHDLFENTVKFNREHLYSNPAPLLDHKLKLDFDLARADKPGDILSDINPGIAATFGFNQSFSVGYLLSSRVVGPEWIGHAKAASPHDFTPDGYIPFDYDGGRLNVINGWDSYNNARYNEAKVFLGDALGKNILFVRHNPRVNATFGESAGAGRQTFETTRQSILERKNEGVCP